MQEGLVSLCSSTSSSLSTSYKKRQVFAAVPLFSFCSSISLQFEHLIQEELSFCSSSSFQIEHLVQEGLVTHCSSTYSGLSEKRKKKKSVFADAQASSTYGGGGCSTNHVLQPVVPHPVCLYTAN